MNYRKKVLVLIFPVFLTLLFSQTQDMLGDLNENGIVDVLDIVMNHN